MPADSKMLRIHSRGRIAVSAVLRLLADVEYAYNGALAFDTTLRRWSAERPWRWEPFEWRAHGFVHLVLDRDEVASLVHPRQRLRLEAVRLGSPGFWDFLGKSVSLEAISAGLNERMARREHKRQEPYRRRMEGLDIADRATDVVLSRYRALREMGVSEDDLTPLRNQLLERPMRELGRHVDSGLIEGVEIVPADERPELGPGPRLPE